MATEAEKRNLAGRLDFIGFDEKARGTMRELSSTIEESIDGALETFYKKLKTTPETAAFFRNENHVQGARKRQSQHWSVVASGNYDERYVDGVLAVGKAHARIGLEPRWYIGGYALLIEQLIHAVIVKRWPSWFGKGKADRLAEEVGVLVKAALLDMDYSISVYLETLAGERQLAEEARNRSEVEQRDAVAAMSAALGNLSNGDLETRLSEDMPANFVQMIKDYNSAVETLGSTIATVRCSAEEILNGTGSIAGATEDLAQRTEQQAAGLEQSSATLHQLTESVRTAADGAQRASTVVGLALDEARASGSVVTRAVEAMSEIERSSESIAKIIGVIDEIAFQTNLLALNAGVEAARAGDAGRGFAVVAQEVRALAQRCANAAQEIKGLISKSGQQVRSGVDLVNNAGDALTTIIGRVEEINTLVSHIAVASTEQSSGLRDVNAAVGSMDAITQRNAAMVQETSSQTTHLREEIENLVVALRGFRVGEKASAVVPRGIENLSRTVARRVA